MDKVTAVRRYGNAQREEIKMHYSMLLIVDETPSKGYIGKMLYPFEDVYSYEIDRHGDRRLDSDGGRFWYNSKGMWDWYEVGGRFRCMIPASDGMRTKYDEDFSSSPTYNRRDADQSLYDMARVDQIHVDRVNPDSWFYVLLPDGSLHERSTYVWKNDDTEEVFNPEWDDFVDNFIAPYMNCVAICIDIHR